MGSDVSVLQYHVGFDGVRGIRGAQYILEDCYEFTKQASEVCGGKHGKRVAVCADSLKLQ